MYSMSLYSQTSNDKFTRGFILINEYIASDYFIELHKTKSPYELLDSIYYKSLYHFKGDKSETLLALTFATIPFKKIPLELPLIGRIDLPLPAVRDSIYYLKNKNLPRNLFFDSDNSEIDNRDKIAHFFGSAFLSYNVDLFNFTEFMSIFIETFEAGFKIEGFFDPRDIIVNDLGKNFGNIIEDGNRISPGNYIILYNFINQFKL